MNRSRAHRVEFVDRMRGMAVVAMVFVHSATAWVRDDLRDFGRPYWSWVSRVSGTVAPVFLFLAGVSVVLLARRARGEDRDERAVRRRVSLRGLQILALGYGLNALFWILGGVSGGCGKILRVDVLHCIGLTLAVVPWLLWPRRSVHWAALAAAILCILGSQITLRIPFERFLPLGLSAWFSPDRSAALFPPLPYAGWICIGLFVGSLWVPLAADTARERRFWTGLAVAALGVYALSLAAEAAYGRFDLERFDVGDRPIRTTVHFFLAKVSVVLLLFLAFRFAPPLPAGPRLAPLLLLGRRSLFAYGAHLVLAYHVGAPLIDRSFGPWEHAAGAACLLILTWGLVLAWDRFSRSKP